jgi:large subunit ribosomal protein L9
MQVILLEKISNLGTLGEVVRVKDGYARNFLIPQGMARRATSAAIAEFEAKRALEFELQEAAIAVKLARRLIRTPEFDKFSVKSGADQRKLLDEVKKRLARWKDEE